MGKTITICCASSNYEQGLVAAQIATTKGFIVLSPYFGGGKIDYKVHKNPEYSEMQKIRINISDAVLVANENNALDEEIKNEIEYAKSQNKEIFYAYMRYEDSCVERCKMHMCSAYTLLPICRKRHELDFPTWPYYMPENKNF